MRYDYKCLNKKCGKSFVLDVPVYTRIERRKHTGAVCSWCHSRNVVKVIGVPGIRFVGKGFYSTDKDKTK